MLALLPSYILLLSYYHKDISYGMLINVSFTTKLPLLLSKGVCKISTKWKFLVIALIYFMYFISYIQLFACKYALKSQTKMN